MNNLFILFAVVLIIVIITAIVISISNNKSYKSKLLEEYLEEYLEEVKSDFYFEYNENKDFSEEENIQKNFIDFTVLFLKNISKTKKEEVCHYLNEKIFFLIEEFEKKTSKKITFQSLSEKDLLIKKIYLNFKKN